MTDKHIRGDSNEMLAEHIRMEQEEDDVLRAMQAAALKNRRKDSARLGQRTCDKVLTEFELFGCAGFTCKRNADGTMSFEGIPHTFPAYLQEKSA